MLERIGYCSIEEFIVVLISALHLTGAGTSNVTVAYAQSYLFDIYLCTLKTQCKVNVLTTCTPYIGRMVLHSSLFQKWALGDSPDTRHIVRLKLSKFRG